ncbi:MAG: hypothetical protein CM1200mP10_01420 [Candidatus Neomarinimicrobiota bacterium]|nr:MAG: hypothetical protein CM1200mP10_01420 [Candidatus Neomarinimicrobiota bacterium]
MAINLRGLIVESDLRRAIEQVYSEEGSSIKKYSSWRVSTFKLFFG